MERTLEAIRANCIPISREEALGGPCWYWQGHVRKKDGYSQADFGKKRLDGSQNAEYIHRVAYELANGEIDPTLTVDHVCRLRACCNPAHLEQKTQKENLASRRERKRQTHCRSGHPLLSPDDYYDYGQGRRCKSCHNARVVSYKQRKKERG